MDATGVDRRRALVLGPRTPFESACVLELVHRGLDVHLPESLAPAADLPPYLARRLHLSPVCATSPTGAHTLLDQVHASGLPLDVAVLTINPMDPGVAARIQAVAARGAGGRLLVLHDDGRAAGSRCTTTVLAPDRWSAWLGSSVVRCLAATGARRDRDEDALARRAIDAMLARRTRVSYGSHGPWPASPPDAAAGLHR